MLEGSTRGFGATTALAVRLRKSFQTLQILDSYASLSSACFSPLTPFTTSRGFISAVYPLPQCVKSWVVVFNRNFETPPGKEAATTQPPRHRQEASTTVAGTSIATWSMMADSGRVVEPATGDDKVLSAADLGSDDLERHEASSQDHGEYSVERVEKVYR